MPDDDIVEQTAVVLALTGAEDPLLLAEAANRVKRRLVALESVAKVELIGDPGDQITIEYDDAAARRLGVAPLFVRTNLFEFGLTD